MKHEVKVVWVVDDSIDTYTKSIKRIKKSGLWDKIEPQIQALVQVITQGKIFSRNKTEINNLELKSLTDHTLADYELKLKSSKNNIRLLYNVFIGNEIYNKETGEYTQYNTVQFVVIGTHSQVRTTTSALQE